MHHSSSMAKKGILGEFSVVVEVVAALRKVFEWLAELIRLGWALFCMQSQPIQTFRFFLSSPALHAAQVFAESPSRCTGCWILFLQNDVLPAFSWKRGKCVENFPFSAHSSTCHLQFLHTLLFSRLFGSNSCFKLRPRCKLLGRAKREANDRP